MTSQIILDQTVIDKMTDNMFGLFAIIPGQYILLDNQVIELSRDHLKIIIRGTPDKTLDYTIGSYQLRYFEGQPMQVLELRLTNMSKYNITGYDETANLVSELLYLRPPTVAYMVYEPATNAYMLKNLNLATIAVMHKLR
jgi:hypothetical protein